MIGAAILIAIGILAGQFFPLKFRERVRALAGKARDMAFGSRPARNSNSTNSSAAPGKDQPPQAVSAEFKPDIRPDIPAPVPPGIFAEIPVGNEVRPTPPNKNIEIGRALANLASFLWRWKWAILVVCFFSLAVGLMRGCAGPLDFGKSRGQIALERELAEGEVEVREKIIDRDAAISEIRAELAAVRATLQANHQRGRDAIEAARPANEQPLDPSVVAAWRQSLDGLCVERADGSRADSCGP